MYDLVRQVKFKSLTKKEASKLIKNRKLMPDININTLRLLKKQNNTDNNNNNNSETKEDIDMKMDDKNEAELVVNDDNDLKMDDDNDPESVKKGIKVKLTISGTNQVIEMGGYDTLSEVFGNFKNLYDIELDELIAPDIASHNAPIYYNRYDHGKEKLSTIAAFQQASEFIQLVCNVGKDKEKLNLFENM